MKQIAILIVAMALAILSACGTVEATNDAQHVTGTGSKIADFELRLPTMFLNSAPPCRGTPS